ncbi:pyruvate dehydrogenase (acetyl-transferring) E1 component subunit alpha [Candidatus Micrarchaeota archaeon]|nr:pyruvate dehydrogenase (acetyl-transferring) E1 component subunit alpha [Candidatus Micrarchaeota archaeon]
MPISRVFEGSVDYIQILDRYGTADINYDPNFSEEMLKRMYIFMVLARRWDKKNIALQRTGRMYTYAPLEGQEAIQVGATLALEKEDWAYPSYRESMIYHMRGIPLSLVDLCWKGIEEGLKIDPKWKCFPYVIPIGTQLPQAVGAGYALQKRGKKGAVLVFGGDGSTSEGEFHDAMNFAGVLNTPTVFLISNNQYAISVPRKWQTKSKTLAQKALAYGFHGVQIDGNDIFAVYTTVKQALKKAREGGGPTLIEAVTYRIGAHTTADDPGKYRPKEEEEYWRERDPITRLQIYMKNKGYWDSRFEEIVNTRCDKRIEEALKEAEAFKQDPKEIFKHVYADITEDLEEQMKECFEEGSQ